MSNTRFKGETAAERLDFSGISDSDMLQLRHKPGTIDDTDKGISKANLLSCPFGVSDTAAGTVAKTASLTDSNPDFSLVSGREVVVCFTTANSASTPTLNFAGSGAYPIYYPDGSSVGAWAAGTWMHLKYFSATVGGNAIQRWILLSPLPVDTVALNNMQSVTSNAVANESAKQTHIFPICTTHLVTNNTSWTPYTYIGDFFLAKYNNYPQVSGKTKKLHLVLTAFTQSSNSITIGIKRSTDLDYTTILYNATVWGGVESGAYGDIYTIEVDPDYLTSHTIIAFKTNNGNSSVAIGSVFAEVYYE